ncbi:hypothetical protein PIB30_055848 [Stylosanthes scabra]|uniref:Uncharacterized protein n=1 Tax=Stylosanthes scabra TaxID=79078 RepID=A0ABU6QIV3_9FABA|nr:hypothetical protein [Stylosanthes scabra]
MNVPVLMKIESEGGGSSNLKRVERLAVAVVCGYGGSPSSPTSLFRISLPQSYDSFFVSVVSSIPLDMLSIAPSIRSLVLLTGGGKSRSEGVVRVYNENMWVWKREYGA